MRGFLGAAAASLLLSLVGPAAGLRMPDLRELLNDDFTLTHKAHAAVAKRQSLGSGTTIQTSPKAYETVNLPAQFFPEHNSTRVKIKYGPFTVQSMDKDNGMADYLQLGAPMPCSNCTLTFIQAGLEYPNGTYANANTSMWLHHTVFINIARPDSVCGTNYYGKGQRWFASGNERSPVDLSLAGQVPTGYYIKPGDFMVSLTELMNQAMVDQMAVMTMEYEYISGQPNGFFYHQPVWLDIAGCDVPSDMPVLSNTTFSYHTNQSWNPQNWTGALVGMGGHLHDGGTVLQVQNRGQQACDETAYYGGPGYVGPAMPTSSNMSSQAKRDGGDMDMDDMGHISWMSSCYQPYVGMVAPGDSWNLTASYNFTAHQGMTNYDGSLADIMGISVLYPAVNMTMADVAKYVGQEKANPDPPQPASASSMMYAATSTMAGMGGMSSSTAMPVAGSGQCMPSADSPGNLSASDFDLSDSDQAMDFLSAILDDTCLQVWSSSYARAFWYGIVVVVGLFTLANLSQWAGLVRRKRLAAKGVALPSAVTPMRKIVAGVYSLYRGVSYPSVALPRPLQRLLGVPPLGTGLMIVSYLAFLLALEFLHVDTHDDQRWQSMSVRAAWLTLAQFPLVILLTMKRNLVGFLTDVGYERLNVFHRWTSRGMLLTATIHFGTQSYGWARFGLETLEWQTDICPPTGIAAWVLLLWMNLSTVRPLRQLSYEFFVIQHFVTWVGFVVALMYHMPDTAEYAKTYAFVAIGLYIACKAIQLVLLFDRRLRLVSRASFAIASPAVTSTGNKSAVTKVTVRSTTVRRWRPGAHVRLAIPRFGAIETHPATILSTPTSHAGDLVFLLRGHGGFTKRIARAAADQRSETREHFAIVDGPYGGLSVDAAGFDTVVLVAGSTGATFTLPILLNLAERVGAATAAGRPLPVRNIVFVWAVRRRDSVLWLDRDIAAAASALVAAGINVELRVHVTMERAGGRIAALLERTASDSSQTEKSSNDGSQDGDGVARQVSSAAATLAVAEAVGTSEKVKQVEVVRPAQQLRSATGVGSVGSRNSRGSVVSSRNGHEAIAYTTGRPDVPAILRDARARFPGEMAVAVCGPQEMAAAVSNTVAGLQWGSQGMGVWLHVEGFAW